METLLLTGTILPNKNILNQRYKSTSLNPEMRYFEYLNAIIYYITQSNFSNIVFCENSNYHFKDLDLINNLCNIYNKQFELLQFNGNYQKTLEKGYGYGDGECIDYAVDNSILLKNSKNWYKITGRYKYININIFMKNNIQNNIFYKGLSFSPFGNYTALFKTSNNFYYKYLYNCKELVDKDKEISLEYVFYFKLRTILFKESNNSFLGLPIIDNWDFKKRFKENILKKLGLLEYNYLGFIIDKLIYKYKKYI